MLHAISASSSVTSSPVAPSADKLAELSHKAGALREQLLHARAAGPAGSSGEQPDTIAAQLLGVEAQISRLALSIQLARLGGDAGPTGDPAKPQDSAPATDAGRTGPGPARHPGPASAYRPAKPPGGHIDVKS